MRWSLPLPDIDDWKRDGKSLKNGDTIFLNEHDEQFNVERSIDAMPFPVKVVHDIEYMTIGIVRIEGSKLTRGLYFGHGKFTNFMARF